MSKSQPKEGQVPRADIIAACAKHIFADPQTLSPLTRVSRRREKNSSLVAICTIRQEGKRLRFLCYRSGDLLLLRNFGDLQLPVWPANFFLSSVGYGTCVSCHRRSVKLYQGFTASAEVIPGVERCQGCFTVPDAAVDSTAIVLRSLPRRIAALSR
jgi:hypothetical protein